jgi:hypothetical protein
MSYAELGITADLNADKQQRYPDIDFGALGIEPDGPTGAKPGSEEKVSTLAARYAAGLPLWHNGDCVDHGPGAAEED